MFVAIGVMKNITFGCVAGAGRGSSGVMGDPVYFFEEKRWEGLMLLEILGGVWEMKRLAHARAVARFKKP